tara:strand:- start:104 stop:1108 length:1005 start_codon:yes stop_codon:yes gene_type:complete
MRSNSNNISSLDLFRGIAGYGVAICHFYYYTYYLNDFQFYSIFFVEFFFILSGFVLYPQLKKVYLDKKNIKVFYYRRWFRTLPPYIVALACYSILFDKFDTDTLKYLFFVQKAFDNFINFDYFSVAWSLSVEEFFYLIFPFFLLILNKNKFLNILFLFILAVYILKISYFFTDVDKEFYRIGTFLRLDSIAFGVLARVYFDQIKNNLINVLLALAILISMYYFFMNLHELKNSELFLFIFLIQIFSINMIIIFVNFNNLINNKFLNSFFSLLSKQTYSIYLFHLLIIHFFNSNTFLMNSNFIFIYYLISIFIFSSLFYYLFEKVIIENRPSYNK